MNLTRTVIGAALLMNLGSTFFVPQVRAQELAERVDCADLRISGDYSCKIGRENLVLRLEHSWDRLTAQFLQDGQVLEEEVFSTDGVRRPFSDPGRAGTYEAYCTKGELVVDSFMTERPFDRIGFKKSRSGLTYSVARKKLEVACRKLK